jgi:hypothetical protein
LDSISGKMSRMKRRKEELETEIENLVAAIANGTRSSSIMAEITKREREIAEISDGLLTARPESIQSRIKRLRADALEKMRDLRTFLNGDTITARAFLLKHVQRIEMRPNGKDYLASGDWDFTGEHRMWCSSVPRHHPNSLSRNLAISSSPYSGLRRRLQVEA